VFIINNKYLVTTNPKCRPCINPPYISPPCISHQKTLTNLYKPRAYKLEVYGIYICLLEMHALFLNSLHLRNACIVWTHTCPRFDQNYLSSIFFVIFLPPGDSYRDETACSGWLLVSKNFYFCSIYMIWACKILKKVVAFGAGNNENLVAQGHFICAHHQLYVYTRIENIWKFLTTIWYEVKEKN
jgi:hypothetical protein